MSQYLKELASKLYEEAKDRGWFKNHPQGGKVAQNLVPDSDNANEAWDSVDFEVPRFGSKLNSEVAEFWEAYRTTMLHQPCDKSFPDGTHTGLTCAEEELADMFIVVMEMAGFLGIDVDRAVKIKSEYNKTREKNHGNKRA